MLVINMIEMDRRELGLLPPGLLDRLKHANVQHDGTLLVTFRAMAETED